VHVGGPVRGRRHVPGACMCACACMLVCPSAGMLVCVRACVFVVRACGRGRMMRAGHNAWASFSGRRCRRPRAARSPVAPARRHPSTRASPAQVPRPARSLAPTDRARSRPLARMRPMHACAAACACVRHSDGHRFRRRCRGAKLRGAQRARHHGRERQRRHHCALHAGAAPIRARALFSGR
jgi:hypothetical protein